MGSYAILKYYIYFQEMKPNTPEEHKNYTLLSTYVLLESKEKLSVEKAINVFNELSQESCK